MGSVEENKAAVGIGDTSHLADHIIPGTQSAPAPMQGGDPNKPGLITELKDVRGLSGSDIEDALKVELKAELIEGWVPMQDGLKCYKHVQNENEYLGGVDAIKTDWLGDGYDPDQSGVLKACKMPFGWVFFAGWKRVRANIELQLENPSHKKVSGFKGFRVRVYDSSLYHDYEASEFVIGGQNGKNTINTAVQLIDRLPTSKEFDLGIQSEEVGPVTIFQSHNP